MRDEADSVPELVMAWGQGWTVCRATPDPVAVPGGFRIEVGRPGHRERTVLHTYDDDSLRRFGRTSDRPGTWLKVMGSPEVLRSALPDGWTTTAVNHLMTVPFEATSVAPPAPYDLRVRTDGPMVLVTVSTPDGTPAAYGRLAPAGEFGIVDQVGTADAHRRRGLGSVVMRALGVEATRRGLRTGILVATEDGRALYHALGWTVRSEVAAAFRPEP
ncbi:GNAT family N-acetyltransferase [Plantactinospora sonchi]|uniref:GNAT family N-acetyltransferase n=1 Tax=Plantactinospora sonchi TaxID=1544735 RepID=A0ABU7RM47_9ACTN